MNHLSTLKIWTLAATAAAAVLVPTLATAQTAQQLYTQDIAACKAGETTQSLTDCLYDARSMRRDRLAGKTVPDLTPEQLAANAVKRCQLQPLTADRDACVRMMHGGGEREGSVAEGAVVMELTTRTVGPVPTAPAAPALMRAPTAP